MATTLEEVIISFNPYNDNGQLCNNVRAYLLYIVWETEFRDSLNNNEIPNFMHEFNDYRDAYIRIADKCESIFYQECIKSSVSYNSSLISYYQTVAISLYKLNKEEIVLDKAIYDISVSLKDVERNCERLKKALDVLDTVENNEAKKIQKLWKKYKSKKETENFIYKLYIELDKLNNYDEFLHGLPNSCKEPSHTNDKRTMLCYHCKRTIGPYIEDCWFCSQ